MKATIHVVTRTQDNGDGGFTTYAYNNERELLLAHPKLRENKKLTDDERIAIGKEIIEEEDPYENGCIGCGIIEIEYDDDSEEPLPGLRLAKPLSFRAGQ